MATPHWGLSTALRTGSCDRTLLGSWSLHPKQACASVLCQGLVLGPQQGCSAAHDWSFVPCAPDRAPSLYLTGALSPASLTGPCYQSLLGPCFLCPQEGHAPVLCWGCVSCAPKRAVPLYFAGVLFPVPLRGPCPCTLLVSCYLCPQEGHAPVLCWGLYLCPQEGRAPVLCWGLVTCAPKRAMPLYFAGVLFPMPPKGPCSCTLLGSCFPCPQEGHAPVLCWGLVSRAPKMAMPLYFAGVFFPVPPRGPCPCILLGSCYLHPQQDCADPQGSAIVPCWGLVLCTLTGLCCHTPPGSAQPLDQALTTIFLNFRSFTHVPADDSTTRLDSRYLFLGLPQGNFL